MILGQRIRLDPNNAQTTFFGRCAGAARFTWNTGLVRWQEIHKAGERPNWRKINAEVNARKATDLAWLKGIPWAVPNNALQDLGNAFSHFFRRVKAGEKPGYPKFKSRKRVIPSFAIEARALSFNGRKVKVPKLGWVRIRQELRFPGKILTSRFTERAGHWYLSIQVEVDESRWSYPHRCETQAVVGVDLGLVDLAVLSTGERIRAPRSLRTHERKLRRLNKELSRRMKGGKNWHKTKVKLGRVHERVANIRKDATHNLTAGLVRMYRWIGIEDLNIKGMAKNRHLAKSVMDAALYELRRQLTYKAPLAGGEVVVADRWFASSKTCHVCGLICESLPLSVRHWTCECGAEHDRDVNAAVNLRNLAAAHAATACCQGSAGTTRLSGVKPPLGRESSICVNLGLHGFSLEWDRTTPGHLSG